MASLQPTAARLMPCLWFAREADEAARFYASSFPNGRITHVAHYTEAGREMHRQVPGSVMVVLFELEGQRLMALNGKPDAFKFNESVSLVVNCDTQAEIDHYWDRLSAGGPAEVQACGWLKDRYGVSWQVVPRAFDHWLTGPKAEQVLNEVMQMKKLDLARMQAAAA
jgi:predicted 3-demethylubiquinone-9 3-methyltransferase (glyoxalase superfamily)